MTTSKILILLVLTICNVCIHWILCTAHEHLKVKVLICLQCGSCGFDAFVKLLLYLWSLCYIGDIVYENSCSRWGSCHGELNATNLIVSLIADHSGDKSRWVFANGCILTLHQQHRKTVLLANTSTNSYRRHKDCFYITLLHHVSGEFLKFSVSRCY